MFWVAGSLFFSLPFSLYPCPTSKKHKGRLDTEPRSRCLQPCSSLLMYCIGNVKVHINISTYLCVYLPSHTSSLVANWTIFLPSIRSVPGVFPFLLLISEYLVVIILDAVSMLLCVCKWLHSAARVEGGGGGGVQSYWASLSHTWEKQRQEIPFCSSSRVKWWRNEEMQTRDRALYHSTPLCLLDCDAKYHTRSVWVMDTSEQSTLISQPRSGINNNISDKCYKITYSLFTFLQLLKGALYKVSVTLWH